MLKILKDLKFFFEDNYEKIHVRNYAKLQKISPPTASKLLESLKNKNLLKKENDRNYFFYYANRDSQDFIDLQRMYYRFKLEDLIKHVENNTVHPKMFLFGSVAKAEISKKSDIDIVIFTPSKKVIDTKFLEKKIKRKIQLFIFESLESVPVELKNNILNGYKLKGNF